MKNMTNQAGIRKKRFILHSFTSCRIRFILIGFILTCATGNVTVEQKKIKVNEGSSVTLKCIVTSDDKPTLRWFCNSNMIDTNQKVVEDDQIVTKYTLSNTTALTKRKTRTYNLKIRYVLSTDGGLYTCHVIFAGNIIRRGNIELAVRYLNENPFVVCQLLSIFNTSTQHRSNYEMEKYQTNRVSINCRADIGKNIFVNITIMKSVHYKYSIPVYFATEEQSNAIEGVNINYPVDVTGLDGWQFWCVAHQSMMLRPVNSSTPVLKKPRVKIVKLKNDSNQFKCEVESYPDATFFQWTICEKETERFQVEECKVLNSTGIYVTLMDIGAVDQLLIICESENAVGTGHGNLTITSSTEPTDMPITGNTESKDTKSGSKSTGDSSLVKWCIGGIVLLIFFLGVLLIILYFYKRFCKTAHADVTDDQYASLQFDTNQLQRDYQELKKSFTTPRINYEDHYIDIPSVNLKEDDTAYRSPIYQHIT